MSRKNWRVKPDIPKPGTGMSKSIVKNTYVERISTLEADKAKLEAAVEHMDEICHTRETRIATLEAQREGMRVVVQSYIKLLETIKSSRKGYVGDHTIYSVQLNESAINSLYAQAKEERG